MITCRQPLVKYSVNKHNNDESDSLQATSSNTPSSLYYAYTSLPGNMNSNHLNSHNVDNQFSSFANYQLTSIKKNCSNQSTTSTPSSSLQSLQFNNNQLNPKY